VEEECCELDTEIPPDASVLHHTSTLTGGGDSYHRTEVAPSDHVDEGEEGRSDEDSGGECVDEEEGEIAGMDTLTRRGKTTPWGRKHIPHEPDEEDDE
jgi:hypothetical protein